MESEFFILKVKLAYSAYVLKTDWKGDTIYIIFSKSCYSLIREIEHDTGHFFYEKFCVWCKCLKYESLHVTYRTDVLAM